MNKLKRSNLLGSIGKQHKNARVLWSKDIDRDTIETRLYIAELRDGVLRAESPEGGLDIHPIAVRWQGGEAAYQSPQIAYKEEHSRKQAQYRDAFSPGLHLEYDFDERIIKKDLVIDALPKSKGDIEVVFQLEHNVPLEINGKQWDGREIIVDGEIRSASEDEHLVWQSVSVSPYTQVALRYIGLWWSPAFPCDHLCERHVAFGKTFAELGYKIDSEAAQWLDVLMHMSFRWSALKGVAEITTPIFKVITNSIPCYPWYDIYFYPVDEAWPEKSNAIARNLLSPHKEH